VLSFHISRESANRVVDALYSAGDTSQVNARQAVDQVRAGAL
jgi:hypothetical protein